MIAGEGIIGILLAILAVAGAAEKIDLSGILNTGTVGGLLLLVLLFITVVISGTKAKEKES